MKPLSRPAFAAVAALFALVMIGTRFHHFGDLLHLPDASMALFFLGGLYLRRHVAFVGFVALAVLVDWLAIRYAGVSDFCVTLAYSFLPLAYAVLWYGGRAVAGRMDGSMAGYATAFAALLVCATVSYAISGGSFYWLGGRYTDPTVAQYAQRFMQWAPLFVRAAAMYTAAALALHAVGVRVFGSRHGGDTARV